MSADGTEFVDRAEGTSVTEAVRQVVVSPLLAVAAGLSALVATGFTQIGEVISALGSLRDFITAIIADGPITIIEAGASVTAGELSEFGVAAVAVGVAVIAASWVVWTTIDPDVPLLDSLLPWR